MTKANYLAVIGDVVGSRHAPDRSGLQKRLQGGLRDANAAFAGQVAADFVLTVGDEFQGLLTGAAELDKLIATLRSHAFPSELRIGLGIGPLDTQLQPQALGMDGPCFHRAREAIERAEARRTPIEVEAGRPTPAFEIYALMAGSMRGRWTKRQRQVADLADSGLEGQEVAAHLNVTPSAVSQHLRAAGTRYLRPATELWLAAIQQALDAVG